MPFVSATQSRVLAGSLSASCYSRGFSLSSGVNMLEVSTLCDDAKVYIPGQESSTASFTLIYDKTQAAHADGEMIFAGKLPVTYLPSGDALGSVAFLIDSIRTEYSTTTSVTGTVDALLSTVTTGETGYGACLAALAAITTDTTGIAVDGGSSSTNGGIVHLHVTAFSGLTSNTITVEHSTNNSTWTTLATLNVAGAGVGAQRLILNVGTTVNRYLRVVDDVTGTGSCTRLVAFARR